MKWLKQNYLLLALMVLVVFAFVADRVSPARATTDFLGAYAQLNTPPGPQAFTAGATVTSDDYYPSPGNYGVTFYTNATQAGTVQVFRVDGQGAAHSSGAAVAVTANTENWQVVAVPMYPRMRIQYVNTNSTGGTVQFEAMESGGRFR